MNATQTAAEIQAKVMVGLVITEHKNNSRCRDGKEQKQELGWKVSVLPIPHCESYNYMLHAHLKYLNFCY